MSSEDVGRASSSLERYARHGISAAGLGVSLGFGVARSGTRIGFGLARVITTTAVSVGSAILDYTLLGPNANSGEALNAAVIKGLQFAEALVLAPMHIGESIASSSIVAASGTLDVLANLLGSEEPSFTLGAFVQLVQREWNDPAMPDQLPEQKFSLWDTTRALIVWASLQAVTHNFEQKRLLSALTEIPMGAWLCDDRHPRDENTEVREVHVTSDVTMPEDSGEIITAEIGQPSYLPSQHGDELPETMSFSTLRRNLRRCSKLCLGSYGGAGMIFFGLSMPTPTSPPPKSGRSIVQLARSFQGDSSTNDAAVLADVLEESEEAAACVPHPRSWWATVRGEHDREIFESFAFKSDNEPTASRMPVATVGTDANLPRFWVLVDHDRKQIVLVLRGTMSFRELAVDLTCEADSFVPGGVPIGAVDGQPGHTTSSTSENPHKVHSGMWRIAKEMGDVGRPVTEAVSAALRKNSSYVLVMCGHSLGAGIVALLALMWADPITCQTINSSGLPGGRKVSAYCFAPPCVTSLGLSRLSSSLVTSFVFSYDLVARLSLGSVRDLQRAAWWLCFGSTRPEESCTSIMAKIVAFQTGFRNASEERELTAILFLALRKTLEANMHMADLFPTGRVLIVLRQTDLPPDSIPNEPSLPESPVRLFEVRDVEVAFGQIIFARDMLSCHLPHRYDQVLHEYL